MSDVADSIVIRNRFDGMMHRCRFERLNESHVRQVSDLQHQVVATMENEELYFPLTDDELVEVLGSKGIALGAYVDGSLIAFATLLFPGRTENNLGIDIGLAETELDQVAYLKAAIVDARFRGNSLQRQLNERIIAIALRRHKWRYVCSTVSPGNHASITSILSLNLLIVKMKRKYNNAMRYIFFQDVTSPLLVDTNNPISAGTDDYDYQQHLFEQGYCGYRQITDDTGHTLLFGQRIG